MHVTLTNLAIVPYSAPQNPWEFINSEAEKELFKVSISRDKLAPWIPPSIRDKYSWKGLSAGLAIIPYADPQSPMEFIKSVVERVTRPQIYKGDKIAETFMSEASFTNAKDKKPIVAAYACGSSIVLGGYEATNKFAFIVHFSSADEVVNSSGVIFLQISNLAKKKIVKPIQLHLRGGSKGRSEKIIEAIGRLMLIRKDLPMEIATQEILRSNNEKGNGLSIDSRNGQVAGYHPLDNPMRRKRREINDIILLINVFSPKILVAYHPE